MELQDRLFSERTGEVLYSVLMTETEYALYSESKKSTPKEVAEAAAVIAGTAGAGALAGKALESKKASSIGNTLRLIRNTAAGAATGSGIGSGLGTVRDILRAEQDKKQIEGELEEFKKKISSLEDESKKIAIKNRRKELEETVEKLSKDFKKKSTRMGGIIGGAAGAVEGAIKNLVRKARPAKKYAGKGAAAGAALGTVGYLAHKANNKKKGGMMVQDRLYSENSGEALYSVLLSKPELLLFSNIREDVGDATIATAAGAGLGAVAGKVLRDRGKKKLKGLIGKRALQGAGAGVLAGTANAAANLEGLEKMGLFPSKGNKGAKNMFFLSSSAAGGTVGGTTGALEGAIEKYLKEKKLKKLVGKGAKIGAAAGGIGYLAHRISKKKKK